MDIQLFFEIFGTVSSVVVAISLTMKNIKRLRIINLIGAAMFAVYGVLIGSIPVALLNFFIVVIDLWYIWRMHVTRDNFTLMKADPLRSNYPSDFLSFYEKDIRKFDPRFDLSVSDGFEYWFVLRDMLPVSLVVTKPRPDGGIDIHLDYAIPNYRDMKNAEFFFMSVAHSLTGGRPTAFYESASTKKHAAYLRKMGFEEIQSDGSEELLGFRKVVE